MRSQTQRRFLVALSLFVLTSLAKAQQTRDEQLVTDAELTEAIAEHDKSEEADRAAIRDVLRQTKIRNAVERYGFDISNVEASLEILDGPELNRLAIQARQLNQAFAGGDFAGVANNAYTIFAIVILVIAIIYAISSTDS